MAIKASNQISFSEQKKVVKITEWYLASAKNDVNEIQTNIDDMASLGWQTQVPKTNADNPFLWNCEEVEYSIGESELSIPMLVASSNNVKYITNYYAVTKKPIAPSLDSDEWTSDFSVVGTNLSSDNKYLWNYEVIEYADGTVSDPHPAIIGVYGDSGEDAVTLKIYSTEGFQFKEGVDKSEILDTIILKIAAYKGAEPITGATFKWEYWKNNITEGTESDGTATIDETVSDWVTINSPIPDVEKIEDAFLEVKMDAEYAFSTIRCLMTITDEEGQEFVFEDYVTLTKQTDVYVASMRFITGSNVFAQGQEHIVGYVELTKNNELVEGSVVGVCYTGESTVEDNIIVPSEGYVRQNSDPDLMYFVHHVDDKCQVVLGKYTDGQWVVQEQAPTKYIYSSDNIANIQSNIFVVEKKDISRSKEISVNVCLRSEIVKDYVPDNSVTSQTSGVYWVFEEDKYIQKTLPDEYVADTVYYVYTDVEKSNSNTLVASTRTTIIDLNDTFVSKTPPSNPHNGQIWFDTNEGIFKVFNSESEEWVQDTSTPPGTTVHTTRPTSYKEGDLWVVEDKWVDIQYVLADGVTNTSTGVYWIENSSGQYVEKTLPDEYNTGVTYYTKEENKISQVNSYIATNVSEADYEVNPDSYFVFKDGAYNPSNEYNMDTTYYKEFVYYPGAILKALVTSDVFNEIHWVDAHPSLTNMQNNIEQYFTFNPSTGLKIGQVNQQFYVNIDAKEMGFYQSESESGEPEVCIGIESTEIRKLEVNEGATFNCPVSVDRQVSVVNTYDSKTSYPGFSWKIESDGTFSLVLGILEGN